MGFDLDQLDLLSPQLPPVRTFATPAADDEDDGCATPTLAANVLPAPLVCPPAPRKPRPARAKKRKHCYYGAPAQAARCYWIVAVPVSHDLAATFAARRPSSSAEGSLCRPPAGKKLRVHVVG
uniref:Uncharacterized protein n=1 Tax=Avena sativa TaxID=4498 RepID=A0ACD5YRA1_AVESA